MLAIDVLGVGEFDVGKAPDKLPDHVSVWCATCSTTARDISARTCAKAYHDALEYREEALSLFSLGSLSLTERVIAERQSSGPSAKRVLKVVREMPRGGPRVRGAWSARSRTPISATSPCSSRCPTSGPIDQLFSHHAHPPAGRGTHRRAVLADITVRLRRQVDHFIDRRDVKNVLELHPYTHGEAYYLGVFPRRGPIRRSWATYTPVRQQPTPCTCLAPGGGYQNRARGDRRHGDRRAQSTSATRAMT